MKVKELIEKLQGLDPEMKIVMSKDGEGNRYSPLDSMEIHDYRAETTWYGDILGSEDMRYECDEEGITMDVFREKYGYEPALVFWPVN